MKPAKTVSVTCACGAKFDREVKRGRPQVWCPKCVATPFYERTVKGSVIESVVSLEASENPAVPERIVNENDRLDNVREEIEAGMALLNLNHKDRYAALVATGMSILDASGKAGAELLTATQNLYAELAPKFYSPGREIDDQPLGS